MIKKFVSKRGDTLIEVALAVGIFSMVAVAIMSVMNVGSSNAQTALEATLAREEVDAQAEAIRFVHSAYVAKNKASSDETETTVDSKYAEVWDKIVGIVKKYGVDSVSSDFYDYQPSTCDDLYSNNIGAEAFAINIQALGNGNTDEVIMGRNNLTTASTYPRLVYGDNKDVAEGIYVTAVKDGRDTQIVQSDGVATGTSAYYDFYIRTCWYGTGDKTPSTVSTVIRLYNPEIEASQ